MATRDVSSHEIGSFAPAIGNQLRVSRFCILEKFSVLNGNADLMLQKQMLWRARDESIDSWEKVEVELDVRVT